MKYYLTFSITILFCLSAINGQTLEERALFKMEVLKTQIAEAEQKGLDPYKEKMTLRTAELFLSYANWDEENYDVILQCFTEKYWTRAYAEELASGLPDKERRDVIRLLDEAIETLVQINDSMHFRQPIPRINWSALSFNEDQLMHQGRPVYTHDYMLEPDDVVELNEYYGNTTTEYISPSNIADSTGAIKSGVVNRLTRNPSGTYGHIWVDNKLIPSWAKTKYGFLPSDDYSEGNRLFTKYDIDNPGAREMFSFLFEGTVPLSAGKNYAALGYMTMNEPHFNTVADTWETGGVSDYTKEKFKLWLTEKHGIIDSLNALWGSTYSTFDEVGISIPIDDTHRGTAMWYDWLKFNQHRVTQWFLFMRDEIHKNDSDAKVHFKVMPRFFAENQRGQGLDFEAVMRLSDISGNDAGGHYYNKYVKKQFYDPNRYSFYWQETSMAYDFFKSVEPDQIIYNTEVHYDSHDPAVDPDYIRAIYWLATLHGMNAAHTWAWVRNGDGSVNPRWTEYFSGTFTQNPLAVNYIASTYMDLNSHAEIIADMQHQRKSVRLFYSETSAIIKEAHMDDLFEAYEKMYYDGVSLGFATDSIIREYEVFDWDVILIHKTPYVTQKELDALQLYLDHGGTIVVDGVSLKMNEYGQSMSALDPGNGSIIHSASLSDARVQALGVLELNNNLPDIQITESNSSGQGRGCTWRWIKNESGKNIISIVNLGSTEAQLEITLNDAVSGTACTDLFTGIQVSTTPVVGPRKVLLLEVNDGVDTTTIHVPSIRLDDPDVFLASEHPNNEGIELLLYFDAGTGETVLSGEWKGITCKLVERDESGETVAEYSGFYSTAIGRNAGVANIRIDITGATPTDSLDEGHYYELIPVFKSSFGDGTDFFSSQELKNIRIIDPAMRSFLEFDDPFKYVANPISKIGPLNVTLHFSAGGGDTVSADGWNGITARLLEMDASHGIVNEYLAYDSAVIGESNGTSTLSIDLTNVTDSESLSDGHYYALEAAFRSSKDGGTDIWSERLTGITISSYVPSTTPRLWLDDWSKYENAVFYNNKTLDIVLYYDAGEGHEIIETNWKGVTHQLVEKDETGKGIAWYKNADLSTIGTQFGQASISLNISELTPSEDLDEGHFYTLVPVMVTSYNPTKLFYLEQSISKITISPPPGSKPSISVDLPSKYLSTEYSNDSTIEVTVNYDAGLGQTVLQDPWNGIACRLIEKNASGSDIKVYSASDDSSIGVKEGIANVTIDISGATATDKLDQGNYYVLAPVFRSSYDPDLDVIMDESLEGIIIVDSIIYTPPEISLDDPLKYTSTLYPNTGTIEVVVNYNAGNGSTVSDGTWNGVTCTVEEKDGSGNVITSFSSSDESTIGTQSGTANISIDIAGATPTDELEAGHYYELVPVFTSTYEGGTDTYLETAVTGIVIIDTTTSINTALIDDHLIVYPNPASDYLYIQQEGKIINEFIKIYNLQGSILLISRPEDHIDISSLSDGTYILKSGSKRVLFVKNSKD